MGETIAILLGFILLIVFMVVAAIVGLVVVAIYKLRRYRSIAVPAARGAYRIFRGGQSIWREVKIEDARRQATSVPELEERVR
jgi:hypothetical protein